MKSVFTWTTHTSAGREHLEGLDSTVLVSLRLCSLRSLMGLVQALLMKHLQSLVLCLTRAHTSTHFKLPSVLRITKTMFYFQVREP